MHQLKARVDSFRNMLFFKNFEVIYARKNLKNRVKIRIYK
jgi:hypothetical protein